MNDIDPQAWLADVLARMPNMSVSRLPELLPWNWSRRQRTADGGLMARPGGSSCLASVLRVDTLANDRF